MTPSSSSAASPVRLSKNQRARLQAQFAEREAKEIARYKRDQRVLRGLFEREYKAGTPIRRVKELDLILTEEGIVFRSERFRSHLDHILATFDTGIPDAEA